MSLYMPLEVTVRRIAGIEESLADMRLPFHATAQNIIEVTENDLHLAARLILAGDDHAKALRGIMVWFRLKMQVGWMIEFETYRHGVECLSTSSTMHTELRDMKGAGLVEHKQRALPTQVYVRGVMMSYQALRHIYVARKTHRHPDWQIFCRAIEHLPYFSYLIYPEAGHPSTVYPQGEE